MKLRHGLILVFLFSYNFSITAQEHPIIEFFEAKIFNDQILLNWNIVEGNNCNGITIFHSIDNITFKEVGFIPGICGAIINAEPYSLLDENPTPNKVNYYKLKLGSQGYTTPLSITSYNTKEVGFTFYPNPSRENINLYLDETLQKPRVEIIDASGKVVLSQEINAGNLIQIETNTLIKGLYIIHLINENEIVGSQRMIHL